MLAVIALVVPWLWQELGPPPAPIRANHFHGGMPVATGYPNRIRVLGRIGYVAGYDETRRNPAWVAYQVPNGQAGRAGERPEAFEIDYATSSKIRPEDYTNSGYDRGHMAPNYAIETRYGQQAQQETFLMSNIVPQKADLNRGPWRELEMKVAGRGGLANRFGGVWVITGPVYGGYSNRLRRGIEVPAAFYKIIIDDMGGRPRALAFIIPQTAPRHAKPETYLTSVNEIERQTGLDFLSQLDDTLEEQIESVQEGALW